MYINLVQKSFPIITINWVVTNEMLIFIIKLRVKRKKKRGVRLILFQHLKEWWQKVESHECVCSTLLKAGRCSTRWCCGQTLQTQMRCREIHNWLQAVLFLSVIPHDRLIHFEAERKVFIVHHFNWFMRIQTRDVCQGYHHWRDKLQLQNLRLLAFKSVSKCLQGELDGFSV